MKDDKAVVVRRCDGVKDILLTNNEFPQVIEETLIKVHEDMLSK